MVSGPGKARSWHCAKAAFLVSRSLDRKLSWLEQAQLHLHLALCRLWTWPQKEIAWIRRLLRQDVEESAGGCDNAIKLSDEARQRIKDALKDFLQKEAHDAGTKERRSFE
jgi:exonuclease VII large subunit